jgi:type IV secretory pathway VirB3-like protein
MSDRTERMNREDTLHVGATRPAMFLGLPMPLAVGLAVLGYAIQVNVTGLEGVGWALAIVGPMGVCSYFAIEHDPYGINVWLAWLRTCLLMRDKSTWGGPSCSPLPRKTRNKRRFQ